MEEDITYLQLTTIAALLVVIVIILAKISRTLEEPMVVAIYRPETVEKSHQSKTTPRMEKE